MGELRTIIELRTMDETVPGENVRVIWNEENAEEVDIAEKTFKKYVDEGWLAFSVTPESREVQIFEFDPSAEKIMLVPPVGGG